jgi:hypothetical protein
MKASSNRKCVVTIKTASVGTATYTAAYLGRGSTTVTTATTRAR